MLCRMTNETGPKNVEKIKWKESISYKDRVADTLIQLNPELFWNRIAILDDLAKNHVKVEEDVEMMWYKWKRFHIDLPAVGDFKWFKFDWFVSDNMLKREDFMNNNVRKKLHSKNVVYKILRAMNKYMKTMGVKTDWDVDYKREMGRYCYDCIAWDDRTYFTGLDYPYWVIDDEFKSFPVVDIWDCDDECWFHSFGSAKLLLKLSD